MTLVEEFRGAWPEPLADEGALTNLLAAYPPETVREVIADRLEADLPRPGLAELSRILRAYAGTPSKDPEPEPPKRAPRRPWITDMEPAPPIASDISERVAELRALIGPEPPVFTPALKVEVDRENLRVVPPAIYEAAAEGRHMFGESRKARLSNDRNANEAAK